MKFFFTIFFFLLIKSSCAQQFTLIGKGKFLREGDTVYLEKINVPKEIAVSPSIAKIKNGSFCFNLLQPGAELYVLTYHKNSTFLFLDPVNTKIELIDTSLTDKIVKGNSTQDDFDAFTNIIKKDKKYNAFNIARVNWYNERGKLDAATLDKMKETLDSLLIISKAAAVSDAVSWIKSHPKSQINSYVLTDYAAGEHHSSGHLPDKELRLIFNSLPESTKQNSWGKQLQYRINGLIVGSVAPGFIQNDTAGKPVKLSDFRGKYVLLDFWASWCSPCRAENPNLLKAYQKFKKSNFEIISVSLDDKKADWVKAIERDGMPWVHVSDLKLRKNYVALQYDVNPIPTNFLIDPKGVIIAKDLLGEELQKKLNQLIK